MSTPAQTVSKPTRTFVVYVEDKPGVLSRVISLVRRRNYNIDSLSVGSTERPTVSRITLVIHADDDAARRIEANLYKLVNVLYVKDLTHVRSVVRELVLLKVKGDEQKRSELLQLCEVFGARVVGMGSGATTIEASSSPEKIDGLLEVLKPFGVLELVRSGAVAMSRGGEAELDRLLSADAAPLAERPLGQDPEEEDPLAA
jgi:acetolactate synthase-1/3 small subunit